MRNDQIIEQLRNGKTTEALRVLYEAWPAVRHFIKTHGGNEDDARDTFQESLLVLYKNVQKPDFTLTAKVSTYLFSVSKYVWKDALKKKNRVVSFEVPDMADEVYEHQQTEENYLQLDRILSKLGEKCISILKMFYYQRKSMDQIGAELGYKNTDTVKTQKFKCLEHARSLAVQIHTIEVREKI